MGIKTFKPKIAILTNLYDAHLDYHGTFNNYAEAKFGVTRNQDDSDYFIYNADQPIVVGYAAQSNAQKFHSVQRDVLQTALVQMIQQFIGKVNHIWIVPTLPYVSII